MILNTGSGAAPAAAAAAAPAAGGAAPAAADAPAAEEKKEEGEYSCAAHEGVDRMLMGLCSQGGVRRGYGLWSFRLSGPSLQGVCAWRSQRGNSEGCGRGCIETRRALRRSVKLVHQCHPIEHHKFLCVQLGYCA